MNLRPVFIGGCDRSGTTMLGDLLGNTRWTFVTPESHFLHDLLIRMNINAFATSEEAARWLLDHFRFATWSMDISVEELSSLIQLDDPHATCHALVAYYQEQTHPDKPDADVWVDHTPDNFRFYPTLKSIYPEARFIHIVRDGRAVSASLQDLDWGPNNAYAGSRHWAMRLQEALIVEGAEGSNCLRVHFEQLLENPELILRQICNFIGIPSEESMLEGGGLLLPAFTREQHAKVGGRPQLAAANAWRDKMTVSDIEEFESYAFSSLLLRKLGYKTHFEQPPKLSKLRILRCYLYDFYCYLRNRTRHVRMEEQVLSKYRAQQRIV